MVGAAQYQDKEIDWVLSAVVGKKKQSYIQIHFKEKFGRTLNHNQIRYIKNKYGKDPRFNSPLVNIRAPMRVTTPEPDGLSEHGDEDEQSNETVSESQIEAEPSTHAEERQNGPESESTAATQSKRKRSVHDPGDVLEKLIKQTTKSQRLDLRPQLATTLDPVSRSNLREAFSPQWNIGDVHLPVSHMPTHPLPKLTTSLEDNCNDSLYAGMYDSTQLPPQTLQFHSTNTGIGWTPSVSLSGHNWGVKNSPVFTSISGSAEPSTMIRASPVMEPYHTDEQTHVLLQSPITAQCQIRLPSSHLVALPVSQFSPSMPNLTLSPYIFHQEQQRHQLLQQEEQQQLHSHIETSSIPILPFSGISHFERQSYLDHVSGAASHLVPSFQEIPIEPACSEHAATEHSILAGTGDSTNWTYTTAASPHDFSFLDFMPSPMAFPFQNVKYTGLTAASSQAIRQSLLNHRNVNSLSYLAQQQQHLPQPTQQHLNFDANTFELLNMVHNPTLNNTTMPHAQSSYSVYNSTMTFPPFTTQAGCQPQLYQHWGAPVSQAHDIHGGVHDISGTIDPRLLVSRSISPRPRPSMSPLNAVKQEIEPPPTFLSP